MSIYILKNLLINICFRDSSKSDIPVPRPILNVDGSTGFELFCGYKVLTPTLYRKRIAAARQAVSMDCYYSYQGNLVDHYGFYFMKNVF